MDSEDLTQYYWKHYLLLEKRVLKTSRYVEIDKKNYQTFSTEYLMLIEAIGAELDHFFKIYCNLATGDHWTIADYASSILASYPDIVNQKIIVLDTDISLAPFQGWNLQQPSQSLPCWNNYINLKHNTSGYFKEANLFNTLNILSALCLLEMKEFMNIWDNTPNNQKIPNSPSTGSKLFLLENWKSNWVGPEGLGVLFTVETISP
jgi:hypothetical protein